MKWVTRERPKIDRIACPWLIRNFVDKEAQFIYLPANEVVEKAPAFNAIPFDVPGVEYTHYGNECTFDYIVKKHRITDEAVGIMAVIVRGADTDQHELASQSAGLWAISAGLSYNHTDDLELLDKGMLIYDALYSWAKHFRNTRHTENPIDNIFLTLHKKFLENSISAKKTPSWARELKELIQDQIDTNLALSLQEISKSLHVHPAYLSREFSKHFENLSFGEYIRKLRIEKAIALLSDRSISISQIAYLTGFSDQSHFTRIFKRQTGTSPAAYRKKLTEK
jgi:AraC-like DNA-binding protein